MSGRRSPPLYWTLTLLSQRGTKVNGYVIPVACCFLNVCMYVWSTLSAEYDMDQPGVVARTSSEEVKRRENGSFSVLVRARECCLARQIRRSRPASAFRSFPTLKAECGAYLRDPPSYSTYNLYVEQTAPPAAVESRACVRENCAIHFYGFLGFNRPLPAAAFRTPDRRCHYTRVVLSVGF